MMGRTHITMAAAGGLAVWHLSGLNAGWAPAFAYGATIGGAFADIDHPKATITTMLGPVGSALSWTLRRISKLLTGKTHRFLTHTLVFMFAAGVLVNSLLHLVLPAHGAWWVHVAFLVGYLTHLFGDWVTKQSTPALLYPLPWRVPMLPYRMRITTGSRVEEVLFFWPATAALVVLSASAAGLPVSEILNAAT